jgi:hypothetical protein
MIQEVLVNGTAQLLKLPDTPVLKAGSPILLNPRAENEMGFLAPSSVPAHAFYGANPVSISPAIAITPQVCYFNQFVTSLVFLIFDVFIQANLNQPGTGKRS